MIAGFKINPAVHFKIIFFPTLFPVCLGSFSATVLMDSLPSLTGVRGLFLILADDR